MNDSVAFMMLRSISLIVCCSVPLLLAGCATSSPANSTTSSSSTSSSASSITGNWQGAGATTSTGVSKIAGIYGSIDQIGSDSDQGQFTTSVLHFDGDCFAASPVIPLEGFNKNAAVTLDSYTINGQYVHLIATATANGNTMQGTYSVAGGCADGASGTFTAQRYAPLTGTYTGALRASPTDTGMASIVLTQQTASSGSGTFLETGTLALSGGNCDWKGAAVASASNYVRGGTANISFTSTDGTGSTALLTGTFDPTAATLSVTAVSFNSGSCAGLVATGSLPH